MASHPHWDHVELGTVLKISDQIQETRYDTDIDMDIDIDIYQAKGQLKGVVLNATAGSSPAP